MQKGYKNPLSIFFSSYVHDEPEKLVFKFFPTNVWDPCN